MNGEKAGDRRAKARWLRDPMLHFALAGIVIYACLPRQEEVPAHRIEVTRGDLLGYLQNRARLFDERRAAVAYGSMRPAERRQLLRDFVRQEALYREARAHRLDEIDPMIRSRLVQQMEVLLRDQAADRLGVSDNEVAAYFAVHRNEYANAATVSFGHVFFDLRKGGPAALERARTELARLRGLDVPLEDAIERGDRFPYQRHYADVVPQALLPELGERVSRAVLAAPLDQWHGPVESALGYHLLRVTRRTAATLPELSTIRDTVARDTQLARQAERGEEAVQRVLAGYAVVLADDLAGLRADTP